MPKVTKSSSVTGKWAKHGGLGTKRSTSIPAGSGVGRGIGLTLLSCGSLERTLTTRVGVDMKTIYRIHISLSNSRHTRSKIRENVWFVLDLD